MSSFARTDTSVLGRWWWTVDRWTLVALVVLMALGGVLILAASPAAADRIFNDRAIGNHQVIRHMPDAAELPLHQGNGLIR